MPKEVLNSRGFTLIELLVVSVISLTLTGFVITSYTSFSRRESLRQAARTLKIDLRFAQSRASSGVKPLAPVSCPTLRGYQMSIASDNKSYTIQALCDTGPQGSLSTVTLPRDITISATVSPIIFSVLTGTVSQNLDVTLATNLTTGSVQSYVIRVSSSGDINDITIR